MDLFAGGQVPGGLIVEGPDAWEGAARHGPCVEAQRCAPTTRSVLGGARWLTSESLFSDANLRAALTGAVQVWEVRLGFTGDMRVGSVG